MIAMSVHGVSRLQAFSLVTILAVAALFALGIFMPACGCGKKNSRVYATACLETFEIALNGYYHDHGEYPAVEPGQGDSAALWKSLCESKRYVEVTPDRVATDQFGTRVISPFGADYAYIVLKDASEKTIGYVLIDPGADKQLGGRLDPHKGFIVEDEKTAADNLIRKYRDTPNP